MIHKSLWERHLPYYREYPEPGTEEKKDDKEGEGKGEGEGGGS